MSARMSNAPVYYALVQAHFNPVAAMGKYVDQVQDNLRRQGYPLFEPQQVTHLVIPVPGQDQAEPTIGHEQSWLITKSDRTAGFILGPSAITFHTTHYQTREEFIPELLRGLQAVHDAVTLDHVSRLGLRYLAAVLPQEGETVEAYLAEGLHGVQFDAVRKYGLSESVFETSTGPLVTTGVLVTRVHRMNGQLGFPPDMVPNGLVPMTKFDISAPGPHAVIDTDHYSQGLMPVDLSQISEQLVTLHAIIKEVFEVTTTPHAFKVWA